MSKKRRVFDIDMPEEDTPVPAGTPLETKAITRRGPMATAIGETADSLRERRRREGEIRAENDALAHEFVRLKNAGLITDLVPVDQIMTTKLTRDRNMAADLELDELKASIAAIGLSNPIQVEARPGGGYELVQGLRRLSAFRALLAEAGDDDRWGRVPATIVAHGEALEALYRRMVDENLVRKDISFAEMASLARAYAEDPGTEVDDVDGAVAILYRSAGRQKRSYVRHFATLMERLEKHLSFPQAIPRALGLSLVKRFESEPESVADLVRSLQLRSAATEAQELAILREYADGKSASPRGQSAPTRVAKTTFRVARPEGEAKCTASVGRLELRANRDFSSVDRRHLEEAVKAFFAKLEGQ